VDGLRGFMLSTGTERAGFDLGVLAILTLLISILSAWLYPKVAM